MGCASGKKISRCAIAKDFEPQTSNQSHQGSHSGSDAPAVSEGKSKSVAFAAVQPQAPVAALLSQPPERPVRPTKPLPPRKTVEPVDYPEATVVEQSKYLREKSEAEQFRRHNSQIVISGYEAMLPAAKDLAQAKHTFDKGRFRQLNPAPREPSTLPRTIEEKLEEIQLFGTITDPTVKSTLTLPPRRQTSVFTGSGLPVIVRPAARQ